MRSRLTGNDKPGRLRRVLRPQPRARPGLNRNKKKNGLEAETARTDPEDPMEENGALVIKNGSMIGGMGTGGRGNRSGVVHRATAGRQLRVEVPGEETPKDRRSPVDARKMVGEKTVGRDRAMSRTLGAAAAARHRARVAALWPPR